ncbi:unnamed protein product [Sphagnum jensenii]|uniref:Uncharacterized protein n=1 Tax=Sphagnum jensenii TaxID=128206 RepID=A0ABP1BWZ6_9BRYO
MDLPAVQVRVIREVNDLEDLIAELTSPSCTLEALKVEKGEGVEYWESYEGGGIQERFASALGASKTLKSLDVAFCSDMLKVDDLCALLQSNEVLKSLTVCSRFAESRPVAGRYTSLRVMLEHNSTLKRLGIAHLYGQHWDVTELAGGLGSIRELVLTEKEEHEVVGSIPELVLTEKEREVGQLPPMLIANFWSRQNPSSFTKCIVILLKALEQNNTLRLLDLSGCSDVQEGQDLHDAILNCLETKPWLHLNLQDTPLSKSESRFTTIQQKLQQNAQFREAFGNWNPQLVNPTGARVFLCGSPRAGKCRSHLP